MQNENLKKKKKYSFSYKNLDFFRKFKKLNDTHKLEKKN